jgi:hypothetical protein
MQEFQACNGMIVVSHSTYSPVLAPNDVFLFLKLKLAQKGRRSHDMLAQKGRRSHDISIMQEQVQATLEDSVTDIISKCFNSGTFAELTASNYKEGDCVEYQNAVTAVQGIFSRSSLIMSHKHV